MLARGVDWVEPDELPDHTWEKSGAKRALELDRDPGSWRVAPSARIMAVLGDVQIYSLFQDRGQDNQHLPHSESANGVPPEFDKIFRS